MAVVDAVDPRKAAREKIIQAANRHLIKAWSRRNTTYTPQLLAGRHLHRAVRIVRHHRLVKKDVLKAAGFKHA